MGDSAAVPGNDFQGEETWMELVGQISISRLMISVTLIERCSLGMVVAARDADMGLRLWGSYRCGVGPGWAGPVRQYSRQREHG